MSTITDSSKVLIDTVPVPVLISKGRHPVQRGLQVLTVACASLALIPSLRVAGSLALRSVALISSTLNCKDGWKNGDALSKASSVIKIGAVACGVVAVGASVSALVVISLAIDMFVQTLEFGKALTKGDGAKAFGNISVLVIDALALASIVTGSWQVMVAASAVSAAAMLTFGIINLVNNLDSKGYFKNDWDYLDIVCHLALTAIGIAGAIKTAELSRTKYTRAHFAVKNERAARIDLIDTRGNVVGSAKIGEEVRINIAYDNNARGFDPATIKVNHYTSTGQYESRGYYDTYVRAHHVDSHTEIIQNALAPALLPTVPVGGTSLTHTFDETEEVNQSVAAAG